MICFNGPFSRSIIEELGNAVRHYMEQAESERSATVDVFSVFIEQAQNVRNYLNMKGGTDAPAILQSGTVIIARKDENYVVACGNVVERQDLPQLLQRIEQIRGVDKAGLKALFKEQMRKPRQEGALGAGLGLIDMARKAKQPIEYAVKEFDERHALFSVRVVI
jgi:hypothetical protein